VIARRAAALLLVGAALACDSPPPLPERPGYAADVEPVVVKRCASCHRTGDRRGQLLLERGSGYAQLVGRSSTQVPALPLVTPGDPARSYLWRKLEHTAAEGEGMPRTPFGARKLPARELELIRRWVATGAAP
jgi:hypothetical protein